MGNLSSTDGDNPGMQDYVESTLEQKTNKENRQRMAKNGHQRYPMCMFTHDEAVFLANAPLEMRRAA